SQSSKSGDIHREKAGTLESSDSRVLMKQTATEVLPLGQMLTRRGLIDEDDLAKALTLQKERKDKVGRILIDMGCLGERDLLAVLSEQLDVKLFSGDYPVVPIEPQALPRRFLRTFQTVPVHLEGEVLN